jgi:hypothetical protein
VLLHPNRQPASRSFLPARSFFGPSPFLLAPCVLKQPSLLSPSSKSTLERSSNAPNSALLELFTSWFLCFGSAAAHSLSPPHSLASFASLPSLHRFFAAQLDPQSLPLALSTAYSLPLEPLSAALGPHSDSLCLEHPLCRLTHC